MYFLKSFLFISLFYSISAFLDNLPSGSLLEHAKINYHKQHVCILTIGNKKCFINDKPGTKEDIMKLFDIYKETE